LLLLVLEPDPDSPPGDLQPSSFEIRCST